MNILYKIREKIKHFEYEFAVPHFFEEMADDGLIFDDIESAINRGQVTNKFKRDPRGLRYEISGPALDGKTIAVICRIKSTGKLLLITVYAKEE